MQTLKGHTDKVLTVAFSSDIRTIASGSMDGSIRIWEVVSGKNIQTFAEHYGEFSCFGVSGGWQNYRKCEYGSEYLFMGCDIGHTAENH